MTSINQAVAPEEHHPQRGRRQDDDVERDASENTPLLPPTAQANDDRSQPRRETSARRSLLTSLQSPSGSNGNGKSSKRRWPSLIALAGLCVLVILIIVFAFLAPSTVEQYGQEAAVFEPTSLSIDSFTASGVRARIQGDFTLDAQRVRTKSVRNLGRFFTGLAKEAESGASEVEVSLPEYGNVVLGTAQVPGVKVDLRDGHRTHVDVLSDLHAGDVDGIRRIANDWIDGRLGQLRVLGKANVPLKSGIVSLGQQLIRHELLFANKDIPSVPAYDIKKLMFREIELPMGGKGMAADASVIVENPYPVELTVPPLAFAALVDNCHEDEPYIKLADVETHELRVQPNQEVEVNVTAVVHQLPDPLTQECPGSGQSPLDLILGKYIHGKDTTIYIRGSSAPQLHTPDWITTLLHSITAPVPLPGRTFGHLVKDFDLADTHFTLPSPFADENSPESNPRISANIQATVALPEEMNFNISISRVRANADVFYKARKLGELDLHKWQHANSTRIPASKHEGPTLAVSSRVENAPLKITDQDVFADVVQALVFGRKGVLMHVKADVDVELTTALGDMAVRGVPAEGEVPVKPISPPDGGRPGHGGTNNTNPLLNSLHPTVSNLTILTTTPSSLTLSALLNLTNPTPYAATIPYFNIHLLANHTLLAHATVENLTVNPGFNAFLPVTAVWHPLSLGGGHPAAHVGSEWLSQFISGYNTTLTLQTHRASFPGQPELGESFARFAVEIPTPRLDGGPSDDDGDGDNDGDDDGEEKPPHFLKSATMHLITSTAEVTVLSPLHHNTLIVTSLDAEAFLPHPPPTTTSRQTTTTFEDSEDEPIARIHYPTPFALPPNKHQNPSNPDDEEEGTTSPPLPVSWSPRGVGYDAVRKALGGKLKVRASARVGVRIGLWNEEVWVRVGGVGAGVRL